MQDLSSVSGVSRFVSEDALRLLERDFPELVFMTLQYDSNGVAVSVFGRDLHHASVNGLPASSVVMLVIEGGHFRVATAQQGIALSPIQQSDAELAADSLQSGPLSYSLMLPDVGSDCSGQRLESGGKTKGF